MACPGASRRRFAPECIVGLGLALAADHDRVAEIIGARAERIGRREGRPRVVHPPHGDDTAPIAVGRGAEQEYRVRSGDSLWSIAQRHGTSIAELRSANDLRSSRIYAGQMLTVPAGK